MSEWVGIHAAISYTVSLSSHRRQPCISEHCRIQWSFFSYKLFLKKKTFIVWNCEIHHNGEYCEVYFYRVKNITMKKENGWFLRDRINRIKSNENFRESMRGNILCQLKYVKSSQICIHNRKSFRIFYNLIIIAILHFIF